MKAINYLNNLDILEELDSAKANLEIIKRSVAVFPPIFEIPQIVLKFSHSSFLSRLPEHETQEQRILTKNLKKQDAQLCAMRTITQNTGRK